MTPERHERMWAVFDGALDLPPDERAIFLDSACADDPELRAEVEVLLAYDGDLATEDRGFLQSPLARRTQELDLAPPEPHRVDAPALPARVGRFRILRLRGEGGMGVVYEAEQENPRRTVALKVIRPGLVSPSLVQRFEQEVWILGRLHHTGIAQVYDAGVSDEGQPYFAMELIEGLPLDEYARQYAADASRLLELVARICDAVQHAHQLGVIHRDLKPGNILVDETGQPKILDFGIARATEGDLHTRTAATRTGQLVGTLAYMSPEQVAADPAALDARSDVYALGVILYELLAGRPPYRLDNLPLPEAARVIRDEEPARLGTVVSRWRGDVETIVARALEKDRARRYLSTAALAEDLRRHLRHEPIQARPTSALYQFRKYARRHPAFVGGLLASVAALAVGAAFAFYYAVRADRSAAEAGVQRGEALAEAYRARLAAAISSLQGHDVADAARHLEEAPRELRGWEWDHLRSRLDDSSAVVPLLPGRSATLISGSEELRIGTYNNDGVRFVDDAGNEKLRLPFLRKTTGFSAFPTPEGLWFVTLEDPAFVVLQDERGRLLRKFTIDKESWWPRGLVLSPDRTRLAICLPKGEAGIVLYDTATGERRLHIPTGAEPLLAVEFSRDGTRLASSPDGPVAHIWNTVTGHLVATCQGHTSKILSVAFHPDGARLLTASHDGTVRQWDTRTGRELEPPYERHAAEVNVAVYSPDGARVASSGGDRTIRLWRASGRQDLAVLRGHAGVVTQLAFTPDGRRLASASPNTRSTPGDSTARIWEAAPEATLPVLGGHTSYVYPVAYSPDGRWIASGSWDHTVRLWDAATGEHRATLPHSGIVRTLAFAPDSTWLVSGCDKDGDLVLWDVATGRPRQTIPRPHVGLTAVAISPDGARIAAAALSRVLDIIDVAQGRSVLASPLQLGSHLPFLAVSHLQFLAFSPDGRWLAGPGEENNTICLWETGTYQRTTVLSGHTDEIWSVAFSPHGKRLVSASLDRTLRLWDIESGECLRVFTGHTDAAFTVAFHPDGTRIASAGRDRAVWLWDVATGRDMARLPGHASYVRSLAFSPNGKSLTSGSGDGTVRLWDTEPLAERYRARRAGKVLLKSTP